MIPRTPLGLLIALIITAPLLLTAPAQAGPNKVVRVATAEWKKGVAERNGNNIPRYNLGRGKIAPYTLPGGNPWEMTFASWVLRKAGYKRHLRGSAKMTIHSGQRVVAYTGSMTAAARRAGKIRKTPRVGYLAMYGNNHVAIVTGIQGRTLVTIGGNTSNAVTRVVGSRAGITHYIAPW